MFFSMSYQQDVALNCHNCLAEHDMAFPISVDKCRINGPVVVLGQYFLSEIHDYSIEKKSVTRFYGSLKKEAF